MHASAQWQASACIVVLAYLCVDALACCISVRVQMSARVELGALSKVARLEGAELAVLQNALATKDNEHKELMAICTDLISQVETLKAQQNQ